MKVLNPEDVLGLSFIHEAQISPDGDSCAYVLSSTDKAKNSDRSKIRIRDLRSGVERRVSEGMSGGSPRWSPDGRYLAFATSTGDRHALTLVDVKGGDSRKIEIPTAGIQGPPTWAPDGKQIAVVLGTRAPDPECRRITTRNFRMEGVGFTDVISQQVCLINPADSSIAVLVGDRGLYSNLDWDDAGKRLLFMRASIPDPFDHNYTARLYSLHVADRSVRELLGEGWFVLAARWIPGGRHIAVVGAYRSTVPVPTTDLWVVDDHGAGMSCRSAPVQGRIGFRFHHDMPNWRLGSPVVVKDKESAWVSVQNGGVAEIWKIALSGPTRCERVVGGERCCMLLNASIKQDKLLFAVTDLKNPVDLHVVIGKAETRLTRINQDVLANWPSASPEYLRFRSADGLELEGWFLAPTTRSGPHPTVMFIHGGPWLAVGHAYRFDFQMLASQGIAVLFANFRGSFGYGEEFARAIGGSWGELGFPDHMAAVDHAIELGLADSKRLGVWGHSHGGFATCWIVGHTDRFRGAVAEAASVDFTTMYYNTDAPDAYIFNFGGKPTEIPEVYRAASPMTYVQRCKTPTLLIHPEKDLRCPISESEQFYRALLDNGCTSELVRLRDVDHMGYAIGPPLIRVGQKTAVLDWFKRFL